MEHGVDYDIKNENNGIHDSNKIVIELNSSKSESVHDEHQNKGFK